MSLGLLYAVVSAVLFGCYLYAMKRFFTAYPSPVFLLVTYLIGFVAYLPFIALSSDPFLPPGNQIQAFGTTVGVILLTAVGLLLLFRAIRIGDVSYVTPISKIVPVFVLPLEVGLLGQSLSSLQIAGVVVATTAIYVANWQGTALLAPFKRAASSSAARLALLSAVIFALVDFGKRVLMQELAVAPTTYLPVMFAGISVLMVPIAVRQDWPDSFRADLPKFLGVGIIVAVGNHIVLLAFQMLPASIVSPIVNSQAIIAVLLAGILLNEQYFRVRLVAAAIAIAGVTMITIG